MPILTIEELQTALNELTERMTEAERIAREHFHNGADGREVSIVNLMDMIEVVSAVPTTTPKHFSEQFKIYVNGTTYRFYYYDPVNSLWKYTDMDLTVSLSGGTAISISGTYPNFTITNTSPGGTPGGSSTQVQYNNGGSFGGGSNFTFDGTTVSILGKLKIPVGTNLY
jgi:hypothetical protein